MQSFNTIEFEKKAGIGYLSLNRPEVRNAISQEMIQDLSEALEKVEQDEKLRVLIVTGKGKAFMAGADIAELKQMKPMDILRWNDGIVRVADRIEGLRQPVIAAINGAAMGGGMELAIACTFRIMARSAKIGLPEVKLGIIPGAGGTQRLPRLIGMPHAAEMILTGDIIDADRALQLGIVNRIVQDSEVIHTAEEMAKRIMANAPIAVELAKNAIDVGRDLPLGQAIQYAQKNCVVCFSTADMQEGMSAFLEKRKPDFKGM